MTARQTDAITDPQSIIAALQQRLDAALAREAALAEELAAPTVELAGRKSEFGERIAQQAATIDVLKVMSASPGDPQPVFDLIVRRATELCNGLGTVLFEFDGGLVHFRVSYFTEALDTAAYYAAAFPSAPTRGSISCRAILDREIVHIRDTDADLELSQVARELLKPMARSQISIPLMRDGQAIGVISLAVKDAGGFSDSQIEMLKTFAEQAVIAISSAETYRALQTRTADLHESLEYQTATSDVLKVISRSAFDLQPVLDTVVETAARLCHADQAVILRREGLTWRFAVNFGFPPEYETYLKAVGPMQLTPNSPTVASRTAIEGRPVHIDDVAAVPGYPDALIRLGKHRTSLGVPLLRGSETIGLIQLSRQRVEPFTDRQIELVSTFADQAVIAIENTRLITEQREALEQQTATAEVLQVINASPGNLTPVFDTILDKAHRLCGAIIGSLLVYDGEYFHAAATHGHPQQMALYVRQPFRPNHFLHELLRGERIVHIPDFTAEADQDHELTRNTEKTGVRTSLWVPLRKDGTLLGCISAFRMEVRPFSEREITLLESFATQAVIAMENARLITETREALEQQTATAEVLQVINASPGDLAPVFDTILEKAHTRCGAVTGALTTFDGEFFHAVALRGYTEGHALVMQEPFTPNSLHQVLLRGERVAQIMDIRALHSDDHLATRRIIESTDVRSGLLVPLRKDGVLLGFISAWRREVRAFTEREITLLENFAAQAVIAMENARLLDDIRQRQEELRVTFENMGDGVAMFEGKQHLIAWNRKFQEILDVPDDIIARRQTFSDYVHYLADRGEYGAGPGVEEQVRRLTEHAGEYRVYERTRPDGRVIEVRHNPVPSGGFVLIFSDITERKRSEAEIRAARDAAEEASRTIEAAYRELKAAQANLIQAEKMASLGQLTAGIAHEIKNPLNFVNNFAALSTELIDELRDVLAPEPLGETARTEVNDLTALLKGNLEKVFQHGQRADGIVKAMLEHSRGSSAERRMVDLNVLVDEALNLAYHGARAQDQSFNITLERDFGADIAPIEVNPQDMTRVFLNVFSNGFYAATRRVRNGGDTGFAPTLKVATRDAGDAVEIRVRDNGTGIPVEIRDKLFQPFFTTKPTGEGTGLGLSITYDIVTKQHGGTITVDSEVYAFTEFVVTLPRQMFVNSDGRA